RLVAAFAAPELCEFERAHTEVGFETLTLDLTAVRGGETRRRRTDRPAIAERNHAFDRALAEALRPERHGPQIVLQSAHNEFGLACRPAIDQRDNRQTLCE